MRPKLAVLLIFIFLVMVFLVQNREPVTVEFLFFETDISGSLFILVSVVVSFIVGFIVGRITDEEKVEHTKLQPAPDAQPEN